MDGARFVAFVKRHKVGIIDGTVLLLALLVSLFVAFEIDIFVSEGQVSQHAETIELDEALLVGGLMVVGLMIFGARRHVEQRRELARRIAAERHARELAYQDALTGLPNRRQLDEALIEAVRSPPSVGITHAVFLLDLNGFKQVNDVFDHGVGDELLIIVGQRLLEAARSNDLIARLGGDEFAILATQLPGAEGALSIARRVIDGLDQPIQIGATAHRIHTAIGIALVPGDADSPEEAMRKADVALYRAKGERRSAARFFEADMDRHIKERSELEASLRDAISEGRIETIFMPTIDLRTQQIVGFDAAPRWMDTALGHVSVERLVAVAEETGLIHEIAAKVLRDAAHAAASWPKHIQLSCDLYAIQLRDLGLAARIATILADAGVSPERLELDITEATVVRDLEAARVALTSLRNVGVRVALDNFGTGYSSLYHLRSIKLDKVKIDGSFVSEISTQREKASIVSALVGLGHGLGLAVSAKGMANAKQQQALLSSGCDQGELIGEVVTSEGAAAMLAG